MVREVGDRTRRSLNHFIQSKGFTRVDRNNVLKDNLVYTTQRKNILQEMPPFQKGPRAHIYMSPTKSISHLQDEHTSQSHSSNGSVADNSVGNSSTGSLDGS
jgi:hypothetical protein